ncbi:MAG: GNAT family N-acetyltransferase [Defluviitaleaceae bacterium]|nr:GNAT family N-acetyltransferase [Defluviitaleaceae bacterium]
MSRNYWQTGRVRVRAFEEGDVERLIKTRNQRDGRLEWLFDTISAPLTPERIRADYAEIAASWHKDERCILSVENNVGEYAGELSIWFTKRPELYFIYGIYILEKFQGQGLGKDALKILLDYYFNELGYRKAEAHVYSFNPASQAFHEKFGFTLEGKLRGRLFSRGKANDVYIYGMLADEFNARYDHNSWRS